MRGRGRGRGRGRPARPQFLTRSELVNKNIFIKKPTYLREKGDGSRASTPGPLAPADSEDNIASHSRASSVTRSSLGTTPRKKQKKPKAGASTSADTTQDYYYGSDFENLSDLEEVDGAEDNESDDSDSDDQRSVYGAEDLVSESELSLPSSAGTGQDYVPVSRPPTPVPVWLQDREIPELVLPPSSEDLLIPRKHILQTCAVYEVLRHFRTQIYLSPFTLEDFSAALLAEQQSKLLSEVHYQMLRLILREDEKQQVQFGPQDHKDSINSVLYLSDIVTWPETLRIYLHTRVGTGEDAKEVLDILDHNEYPFVPFDDRLKVLQAMVDMVLVTPIIRNEFQREGPIVYDDHCRSCHKLGDLLCCETCPATYHLECVNPPLKEVPDHDWQCEVCRKHQVKGVTDCVSDMEKNGAMSRQEVLGYDRAGRRYWFLCRRLFVESPDSPESLVYYSTSAQYAALLARLDRSDLEDALCMSLQELHYDIQRQMALTEEMTEQRLKPGATSYLQQENDRLKAVREAGEEKKEDADAADTAGEQKNETDSQNNAEGGAADGGGGGGGGGGGDAPASSAAAEADGAAGDTATDEETKPRPLPARTPMVTRTKSGALPSKAAAKDDGEEEEDDAGPPAFAFKLGDASDRAYQRYDNQYTSTALALNRFQLAEDKDKRRHMSHKFSLTQASEFEWSGTTCGSRQQLRQTLRQTLQELVTRLPTALMHPSWPQLRRAWTAAVTGSTRPQDFARALTVISALIKPRLICTVWADSLAHVSVQRVTVLEREERKKAEKREKRERDEEELAQLRVPFVKYNLRKVKHQVWKQRGEEYRIHGQTGWLWLSSTRRYRPAAARERGHAAGPHRRLVTLAAAPAPAPAPAPAAPAAGEDGGDAAAAALVSSRAGRNLWLPSATYRRLLERQAAAGGDSDRLVSLRLKPGTAEPQLDVDGPGETVPLSDPPPPPQSEDVLDVSAGLRSPARRALFPRSARPAKLDKLLAWREELERRERGEPESPAGDAVMKVEEVKTEAREALVTAEKRLALLTVYPCYNRACREGRPCYSTSCRQAAELRQRIQQLREAAVKTEPDTESPAEDAKTDAKPDANEDAKPDAKPNATPAIKTEKMDVDSAAGAVKTETDEETKPARFSGVPTSAAVKLEVIRPVPKKNYVRYPLYSKFRAGGRWSMLVLPSWELRQLARRKGQKTVEGFNYAAKNNSQVWPYPCPRASLRTGWLYRTSRVPSLHAAGLQLRILWACVRWDDIDTRPQQVGPGEFQITTDTGMVRSLVLKHRDEGRFRERTVYYRRRVTILFDNPVIVEKEYTSSARSGLRKRRRVIESSENPSSAVTQEWVPEDALEIFEIKYYHEKLERLRQERQQAALQKRTAGLQTSRAGSPAGGPASPAATTTATQASTVMVAGAKRGVTSAAQLKTKLEEAVRQSRSIGKGTKFMVKPSNAATPTQGAATPQRTYAAMRKIITKDGKIIAIQSTPTSAAATVTVGTGAARAAQLPLAPAAAPAATTVTVAAPAPAITTAVTTTAAAAAAAAKPNQIQIIKLPDGKLQVKGLKPGQQLVQLPSGQLQLVSGGTAKSLQAVPKQAPPAVVTSPSTPSKVRPVAPAGPTEAGGVSPVQETAVPVSPSAGGGGQKVVQKMVTQVVDLAGLTKPQLVGWQQRINEGKAKLALVNGRRVILHNVLVNQSVTAAGTDGSASDPAALKAAPDGELDEDDPPPEPAPAPAPAAPLRQEEHEEEQREEEEEAAAGEEEQEDEVKSELTPGRRITATANIVQTVAGPRVVIQGVPTQGLSQSQLHNLQQQVKAELAKGPMLTGLRDIHLTVPADVPEPPPAPAAAAVPAAPAAPAAPAPAAGQSLLQAGQRQSLLSPRRVSEAGAVAGQPDELVQPSALHQDFTVTQEYIQQSINNALNSDNLKPEIAEKLLQLRKKPAGGGDGGPTPPRPPAAQRPAAPAPATAAGAGGQPPKKRAKTDRPRQQSGSRTKPRTERKMVRPSARLQQLGRRKEQLKKEILRKRLQMENQLQLEISKQLSAYKRAVAEQKESGRRQQEMGRQAGRQRRDSSPRLAAPAGRKSNEHRRKSEDGRKRKSSTSRASPAAGRPAKKAKKEAKESPKDAKKIYCICRQPYDASKFYVGCDMCSNWYHGTCVGISPRNSKKVKAFICQQCQSAKENRELFCFCRTEYDESQFYIGCDTCEDWFHGRCVGILPSEGDDIDDYVCPRCEPNSRINGPNFRPLTDANYAELRRVFKQIKNNKNAWPFIEPVDPDEVPNYYKVIKEPMDLQTMEDRLESRHYGRLCDFTGDMIVVLDNCKYFNPPGTRLATCGTNLEAFFRAELKKLRTKI